MAAGASVGWFANSLNVAGLLLLGYRVRQGWLLGIAAEVIWVFRAYGVQMYDLMFISGVYIAIASVNYARWGSGDALGPHRKP